MISIKLENGKEIVPADNLKVSVIFYNPAFDKDRGERTYTFPMFIPASPGNNVGMEYLHRLDSNINLEDAVATMMSEGLPLFDGKVKIGTNNPTGTNIEFVSSGRYLLDHLDEIKLGDAVDDITIDVYGSDLIFFNALYVDYGDGDDYGPFGYQGQFTGIEIIIDGVPHEYIWTLDVDGDWTTTPYEVIAFLVDLINADYPGLAFLYEGGGGNPWLRIDRTIVDIDAINPINMEVVQDAYDYALWEDLHGNIIDWIRDKIENGDEKICFPSIRNNNFYDNKNPEWFGWINYYLSLIPAALNESSAVKGVWQHSYAPMYYFKYVMERIRTKMNISNYGGVPWEETDLDQLIIFNDYSLDKEIQIPGYELYINVLTTIIESKKHLPEITAKGLLVSWLTEFNLHYRVRGESMIFYRNVDQLEGSSIDWTDKCEPAYEQDKKKNTGFTLDYKRDEQESYSKEGQLIKLEVGRGGRKIELPAFSLYMSIQDADILIPDEMLVPTTLRPGRSDSFGTSAKTPMLKFLYYRGLQPSESQGDYPMASHGWMNKAGDVVGDRSLGIQDNKGLYEKYWKGWAELDPDDTTTVASRLSFADIRNTIKWDNPKRTVITDNGQVNIIIKELHVSISHGGVGLSKTVGVRMR